VRKNILVNEFWDSLEEIFVSNEKRIVGNIPILQNYGDAKISHFNTGSGISYYSFMGKFNQDVAIEGKCYSDSTFLRFNTGSELSLEDPKNNKEIQLSIDRCWYGKEYNGYKGTCLYSKDKTYVSHSLLLENK